MGAKPRPNEYVILKRRDWLRIKTAAHAAGLDAKPEMRRIRLWPMTLGRPLEPSKHYVMREVFDPDVGVIRPAKETGE